MNRKKIIFSLLITLFLFNSCDDYLDILPEGENAENFFNTPQDYQDALVGVYDLLATTYLNQILGEIASDNALCGGENSTDVLDWQQIDDMTHNPDNGELRRIFSWMYAGISRANYIMEFKDKLDFPEKAQILAETKFLRSYYYFELVKYFGDVPLVIDKRLTIEESQSIGRTPTADIYAQLETDLAEAIADLPWTASEPGRATKGAAYALLGKINLYQEDFEGAKDALDEVIGSMQYDLVTDFGDIFTLENENNIESVFEVQYVGSEGASFDCFVCVEGNIAVGFGSPRFNAGDYSPYADGFSFNVPVQSLVDAYPSGDPRLEHTIFDINAFVSTRPDVVFIEGYEHTGYFNKKYIAYNEGNAGDPHLTHSNNYRAIRFSDVLLMAAEAYNRGGFGDIIAQGYLNRVRTRVGLPDITLTGNALTEAIWEERRLELAGEGHRFFDQVRTGQTSSIPGFASGKHELFPIPRAEIELAGNTWSQNPGY